MVGLVGVDGILDIRIYFPKQVDMHGNNTIGFLTDFRGTIK
jgi:hypothetical protein